MSISDYSTGSIFDPAFRAYCLRLRRARIAFRRRYLQPIAAEFWARMADDARDPGPAGDAAV
jgi:hypothetical protein